MIGNYKMNHFKEVFIGFIVAVFATLVGTYLCVSTFSKYDFATTAGMIEQSSLYGQIISLGALPNIFVFFIFVKKNQESKAKGVLLATILIALATLFLKFI
jgi:heme/copper-type cytochrome/quinol oxidase subunit 4